jgi:PAS domain S-box-containing protein
MIKALMHKSPDFIYFKDVHGRFVSVSNACALYLNTTIDDMIGKTDYDFFPPNQAEESSLEDKKIIETREPIKDKIERKVSRTERKSGFRLARPPGKIVMEKYSVPSVCTGGH